MDEAAGTAPAALPPEALRRRCRLSDVPPEAAPATPAAEDFGQARATEAIALAREIRRPGFNLFVTGPHPSRHRKLVESMLRDAARSAPTPSDWAYVNNFEDPMHPVAIELPAGRATELRDRMAALIEDLRISLPAILESEEHSQRLDAINEEFQSREQQDIQELSERARQRGTVIIRTPMGFAVTPFRDGEVLGPEDFGKLPEEEREATKKAISEIQDELQVLLRRQPAREKERRAAVRLLDQEMAELLVDQAIDEVRTAFAGHDAVDAFLAAVRHEIVNKTQLFLEAPERKGYMPVGPPRMDGRFDVFSVNPVVANTADGAPVVHEDHPTMMNLVGRVEHVAHQGALLTNFTLIRPGALHQANGGYLLLDLRQILGEAFAWSALKRSLQSGAIRIASPAEYLGLAQTVTLAPGQIPLDVKVVVFAERLHYHLLGALDPEMRDLFKLLADFEDEADWDDAGERDFAAMLATLCGREGLLPLARGATEALIEHAGRLAGDAKKLSLDVERLADRLREADHYGREAHRDAIAREDIERGIDAERRRGGRLRERAAEAVLRDLALITVTGAVVGQMNGLSVVQLGEHAFGRPSRITARVRIGAGEVVDIEREVKLGGPIHSKGVLILSGYLAARFALDAPMSLSASLVFEQSYGGVEGDSASCAELCALLSALSDLPFRQDLALSGSVNQHGAVQPVGGVNEKIEGFFEICSARGLTGTQGVIIPAANVQHLMLREDVVDACRNGRFAVYAVGRVDEAVTLLAGRPAGERSVDGAFPEGSVNAAVERRLRQYAETRRSFAAESRAAASSARGEEA